MEWACLVSVLHKFVTYYAYSLTYSPGPTWGTQSYMSMWLRKGLFELIEQHSIWSAFQQLIWLSAISDIGEHFIPDAQRWHITINGMYGKH